MTKFDEQIDRIHHDKDNYNNIFPNEDWDLRDYKEMFYYIKKGYLVQGDACEINCNGFVINEDWDWGGDDEIYEDI